MTDDPFLDLSARLRVGTFEMAVDLTVPPGTTVAVVGPNGAGKTTLLRAVAGLVPLDAGHLRVGGATWDEPATRCWVAPERRSVGFVFQERLLFPHLSVVDNVAFGLRAQGLGRRDARRVAHDWLERIGLGHRGDARPGDLSGGQSQRVALARALAIEPAVLVLDEPLVALDTDVHAEATALLTARFADHTGVRLLVTHDPSEALALADMVLVVEDGRMTQYAAPGQLRPTGYLARFLT